MCRECGGGGSRVDSREGVADWQWPIEADVSQMKCDWFGDLEVNVKCSPNFVSLRVHLSYPLARLVR